MQNYINELDKPLCECGVVGVYNVPDAAITAYYALHSLQHRGQEAAGITTLYYNEDKKKNMYSYHKGLGLVLDVFDNEDIFKKLKGTSAIGHNRYSTTGSSNTNNIQPFNMIYHSGIISLAHNGNLTNTNTLRDELRREGAIFQTTTDSEIFMHLIARSKKEALSEQIRDALQTAVGSYSLVILTEEGLFAARDPNGVRPLSIGRKINLDGTYSFIIASESCAFDINNFEYIRTIKHNELILINEESTKSGEVFSSKILDITPEAHHCIFEYVYFSLPNSKIYGHNVDKIRRKLGKKLAEESPLILENSEKVCAIPVPDSANTCTLGFSRVNNDQNPTVFEIGLLRSHYVGRTFIAPGQNNREFKVKVKFSPVGGVIKDRHIVLVDDSIVRGTTSKSLVKIIRDQNPKSLHCRVSSPQIKYPCYYGMDFPSKDELIANHYNNEEEIGKAIGVDSLHFLSEEKLLESVPKEEGISYCTACFTGIYPIEVEEKLKNQHKCKKNKKD